MILLDTHVWLWLCLEPQRLSTTAAAAIRRALGQGGLSIASISLWEVAMMVSRGRVVPQGTAETVLGRLVDQSAVSVGEITPAVAAVATQLLDDVPADPADRIIAATARVAGLPLVTRDLALRRSRAVETIW